jgi:hypothetical protein
MLLEFEIGHCTRRCSATGRALAAGETYFSTLHIEGGAAVRRDFAAEAWAGAPEKIIGWWQSRLSDGDGARSKLAPHDVLLNLFAALAEEPAEAEFRYVLGLLLLRRRLLKLEEMRSDPAGDVMVLDCPRREERLELLVAAPDGDGARQIEQRLGELLFNGQ